MLSLLTFAVTIDLAFSQESEIFFDHDDLMEQDIDDLDRRLDLSNLNVFSSNNQNTNAVGTAAGGFGGFGTWGATAGTGWTGVGGFPNTPGFNPNGGFPTVGSGPVHPGSNPNGGFPTVGRPAFPPSGFPAFPGAFPAQPVGPVTNLNAFGSNGNVNTNIVKSGGIPTGGLSNLNIASSGNKNTNFVGGRRRLMSNFNFMSHGNSNLNAGSAATPVCGWNSWGQWICQPSSTPHMSNTNIHSNGNINTNLGRRLEVESLIAPGLEEIASVASIEA